MQIINVIQIIDGIVAGIASFPVHDEQLLSSVRDEVEDYCVGIIEQGSDFDNEFEYYFEDDVYQDDNGYTIQIVNSEI